MYAEQLNGEGSNDGPDDEQKKVFFELVAGTELTSFHADSGGASSITGRGGRGPLPFCLEPLSYVTSDALGCYPALVGPPSEASFTPSDNLQETSTYSIEQQQQQLSLSPFNRSLYAAHHLAAVERTNTDVARPYGDIPCGRLAGYVEPPASVMLSAVSSYCDTIPPNTRTVSNDYFCAPETDSRFSSQLLILRSEI